MGILNATDPDSGNTFTYTLVAGTGSTDNASFTIDASGNLKTAAVFDYETKNSYAIRVRTTDQGGLFFEKQFTISVTNVNEAPTLANSSTLLYAKGQAATAINTVIAVADVDSPNLASATVTILNYLASDDRLVFVANSSTMGNISGGFSTSTGKLTLTSSGTTATQAQWQAALRAVAYQNVAANPNTAPRTVSYQVSDGSLASNAIISKIGIGSAPALANSNTLAYAKNQAATAISPSLTVSDPDHPFLASAKVTITNYFAADDILGFVNNNATNFGNITSGFSGGVLTLTSAGSSATVAQWQNALRAVTYFNRSGNSANIAARTVTYQITDGFLTSNVLTNKIGLGSLPVLANSTTSNYSRGSSAIAIDPGITVTDTDHATLSSATVKFSNFISTEDLLGFTNTGAFGNIQGSFDATTGTLTLTSAGSSATVSQFQAALRAVTYFNTKGTAATLSPRVITFQVSDGTLASNSLTNWISIA